MLDQRLVRDNPDAIAQQLERRGTSVDLTRLQLIAQQQRSLEEQRSNLQADGNRIGKEVGQRIKAGADPKGDEVAELRQQGNVIKQKVSVLEEEEKLLNAELRDQLLTFPNLPSDECPDGKDETDNVEIRRWGEPRQDENLEEHWQIADRLNLFDTERSVRIAQSRFVTLDRSGSPPGTRADQLHAGSPHQQGISGSPSAGARQHREPHRIGAAPKFADESFRCAEDDLWLTPTAEVPVTSLHRDEIIPNDQLPLRYAAYSPCFRREAGSYGRDTRGLIRLHQFNKVELYWFCHPDHSAEAHQQITADAEAVLQALELPYRVLDLCTGDLGFSAQRTFDLEVWLPGAGAYREISSCSVCGDFQARRSSIRTKEGKNSRLVHTLNGSGLAVGRTMAAVLENGQQADGSIRLPAALVPYVGIEELKPE